VRGRDALGDASQAVVHSLARGFAHRANRAVDVRRLRDHVRRGAGVNLRDRHDRRVEHRDAPRDEHLQRLHDLAGDRHGVERAERFGGMASLAGDNDVESV